MNLLLQDQLFLFKKWGWSSDVNVLGKRSVPGRPTNLDHGRARDSAFAVGAGGGGLDSFFCHLSFLFLLRVTTRYRLKYCLNGPLNATNQPTKWGIF